MKSNKEELNLALEEIKKRHGAKAISKALVQQEQKYIPFGYPSLDALVGGVPRGRITEIVGKPTSGATTLALQIMCAAQEADDLVIYVDLATTFDPDYSLSLGLRPETLLLVRPSNQEDVLDTLFDVATSGVAGVVTLNSVSSLNPKEQKNLVLVVERLKPLLSSLNCALILLKHAENHAAALNQYASLRLHIAFTAWVQRGHDIYGYDARVTVKKSKNASEGKTVPIRVMFDGAKGAEA